METKILFLGTPEFAAEALKAMVEAKFNIIGAVTQPNREAGRGKTMEAPEVKKVAEKFGLPVFQPINKEELSEIALKLQPELILVAAYGMIIPQNVLDIPKYKSLNIHGSLLPKYRGSSCIAQAILEDEKTGITIMEVTAEMDAGPIISQVEIGIKGNDTKETLAEKLAEAGAKEIVRVVPLWIKGELEPTEQEASQVTYCKLIKKEDGQIDWSKPAEYIEKMTRAYYPWPSAYTFLEDKQLKIISAVVVDKSITPGEILIESNQFFVGTGNKSLELLKIQPEGKKEMPAKDFLNGAKDINKKVFKLKEV